MPLMEGLAKGSGSLRTRLRAWQTLLRRLQKKQICFPASFVEDNFGTTGFLSTSRFVGRNPKAAACGMLSNRNDSGEILRSRRDGGRTARPILQVKGNLTFQRHL